MLDPLLGWLETLAPTAATLVAVILLLAVARRLLDRWRIRAGKPQIGTQLALVALSFGGLLAILIVLPISEATRGQLVTLLGIIITASIALSSSTIVSNAMAGVMVRLVGRRLNIGDFVIADGHSGRITELGLLSVQIQPRDRNLTWIPNQWIIERPATLIRPSGTIISTQVALSYRENRSEVEPLLVKAAVQAGLENGFAYVQELGNHAVTYTVRGLLTDTTQLLQSRPRLRAAVLDTLHGANIEIVSPVFETSRRLADDTVIMPQRGAESEGAAVQPPPEHVMFDRAQAAAARARKAQEVRDELAATEAELKAAKGAAERSRLRDVRQRLEKELLKLESEVD
jgi:small-conductance mechanosensitive channel